MIKSFGEMPDEFNFDENGEGGGFSMEKLQELEKMLSETLKSLGIDENEMMNGMGDSRGPGGLTQSGRLGRQAEGKIR